jgi:hypothetical protein
VVIVGTARKTTNQTGIGTSATDIASMSITHTFDAAKKYRVVFHCQFAKNNSTNEAMFHLQEGGTIIQRLRREYAVGLGTVYTCDATSDFFQLSSGSHTVKVTAQSGGTSETIDIQAGATVPCYMHLEEHVF